MVVSIADFQVGETHPFFLIAGPCVIESEKSLFHTAEKLKETCHKLSIPLVFKASFDKANRTSVDSFRGPGFQEGLRLLERVKTSFDLPVTSDVHWPGEISGAAEVLDILQVPAFLCRQTDLLVAAGRSGRVVNVKKGQFLAPEDTRHFGPKVTAGERSPTSRLLITERGTTFGYHDLVVDFRGLKIMSEFAPVIFDATHSVQQPGSGDGKSGGRKEFVPVLARSALAAGCAGLFLEVHEEPGKALSDGPNMISLEELPSLLSMAQRIDCLVKGN